MDKPKVILVMLRQPKLNNPREMRTDPLWEFGSFGCTGCHRKNLMNLKKLTELEGIHFGFAQNGPRGVKLVHVTPPVRMRHHGAFGEATWSPAEMPLTYASAPTLVNNLGASDIPELIELIRDVHRGTPIAQFSSKFRSRRLPVPPSVGKRILETYKRFRQRSGDVSETYVDALPCRPPQVDDDRQATYRRLLGGSPLPRTRKRPASQGRARC
jgi:hypothetical protein